MNYTNKDYYNYILKVDHVNAPLHHVYQKILNLLLKEGLDQNIHNEMMSDFFQLFELRQFEWQEKEVEDLKQLLYYDAAFRRFIENGDGSYSIYPTLKELPTVNDLLQYYSLGLKMSVKEIIDYLTPVINEKKLKLKNAELKKYDGSPKYLILRTKAVYDAVVLLNHRDDIEDKFLVSNALSDITVQLNTMLNIVGLKNNEETYTQLEDYRYQLPVNKEQYDLLKDCYEKILKKEDILTDISNQIWQSYALKNNGVFIHQFTQEAVESDQMKKICTSFFSDHANTITNYSNANIGYAYPMNIDSTFAVCESDVGSWQVTKEECIERAMPEGWQFNETNLWYEDPHHSKLFPPEYIEQQVITNQSFAEIIIDNRKKNIKPLYCFYTADATPEQIEEINGLARKQGLEVKCLGVKEEKMSK